MSSSAAAEESEAAVAVAPAEVTSDDLSRLVDQQEEQQGQQQQPVEVKVYKKRWYILFVFSLLGIYQVNLMTSIALALALFTDKHYGVRMVD